MHGSEDSGVAAPGEVIGGLEQHLVNVDGPFGCDSQGGEHSDQNVVAPVGDSAHLQPGPPRQRRRLGQISLLNHLKAHLPRRLGYVGVVPQAGQGVAPLDPLNDLHVFVVFGPVLVRRNPLVRHVQRSGLQNPKDLSVDFLKLRRVAGGLNGVRAVEAAVGEGHLEEVAAHDLAERVEAGLLVVLAGAFHLVLIDRNAHDVGARVGGDGPHGPTHAASDVQNSIPRFGTYKIDGHLLVEARGVAVGFSPD